MYFTDVLERTSLLLSALPVEEQKTKHADFLAESREKLNVAEKQVPQNVLFIILVFFCILLLFHSSVHPSIHPSVY